jgi:hypothetical protein
MAAGTSMRTPARTSVVIGQTEALSRSCPEVSWNQLGANETNETNETNLDVDVWIPSPLGNDGIRLRALHDCVGKRH